MKFRVKSTFCTVLLYLPLILVAAHDLYFWVQRGGSLHLSQTGYLLQHYTPYENTLIHLSDHDLYRKILRLALNARAIVVAAIPAALMLLWINFPRKASRHRYR